MTEWEAVEKRISCRAYRDEPLPEDVLRQMEEKAAALREASGLRFVPVRGKPAVKLAAAMFSGRVDFCAALIGPDDPLSAEKLGYYGQELVLYATRLGLGTCWVAGTYDRKSVDVTLAPGEKLWDVIPIGWPVEKTPKKQILIRAAIRGEAVQARPRPGVQRPRHRQEAVRGGRGVLRRPRNLGIRRRRTVPPRGLSDHKITAASSWERSLPFLCHCALPLNS